MLRALMILLVVSPALAIGGESSPVSWSPDGRWLAFTSVARGDRVLPAPGWIFETGPRLSRGLSIGEHDNGNAPGELTFRVYATSVESEETSLLQESRKPLTAPAWSPDGKSLAFGRVAGDEKGDCRFELVVQDGPRQERVLMTRPLGGVEIPWEAFAAIAPAWSPDGRFLAICGPSTSIGSSVVRADNGRVLKTIELAAHPSWSPDSSKLAFIASRGTTSTLYVLDESFGPTRRVADLGQTYQPPWWTRDGKSVLVATRRQTILPRRGVIAYYAALVRVNVGSGLVETLVKLSPEEEERQKEFRSVSFTLDRDGEELFFASDVEGKPNEVFWYRPSTHETHARSFPIDHSVQFTSLTLASGGKPLALRLGNPGPSAPVGFWFFDEKPITPIVPDDASRVEWLCLLISTSRQILRSHLSMTGFTEGARASILPTVGDFSPGRDPSENLKRIARVGRRLCERPADLAPADAAFSAFLNEARFFFDYLQRDDRTALESLGTLEASAVSADQRVRLLCLRGQIFIGLGDLERAKDVATFVKAAGGRPRSRLETTPVGIALIVEPDETGGWAKHLSRSIAHLEEIRKKPGAREEALLDHPNPDAPPTRPRFGDRENDPGVFAPLLPDQRFGDVPADANNPAGIDRPRPPVMPRFQRSDPPR